MHVPTQTTGVRRDVICGLEADELPLSPKWAQYENSSHPSLSQPEHELLTPPQPSRPWNGDDLKSFKVSLEDPAWKVLPVGRGKAQNQ